MLYADDTIIGWQQKYLQLATDLGLYCSEGKLKMKLYKTILIFRGAKYDYQNIFLSHAATLEDVDSFKYLEQVIFMYTCWIKEALCGKGLKAVLYLWSESKYHSLPNYVS